MYVKYRWNDYVIIRLFSKITLIEFWDWQLSTDARGNMFTQHNTRFCVLNSTRNPSKWFYVILYKHMEYLRRIMGTAGMTASNQWLFRETDSRPITSIVRQHQLWLYGHVACYPEADAAVRLQTQTWILTNLHARHIKDSNILAPHLANLHHTSTHLKNA